jgi:hypothetical protein
MDETWFKPFCPHNIILVAQSTKEVGGNISTCESLDLGFFGHLFIKGKFPTFGSFKLGFLKVFFSFDVINEVFLFPLRLIHLWIFQQQVPKTATCTYNTQNKIKITTNPKLTCTQIV